MLTSLQSRASYLSQGFGDNDWEVPPDDWLIMPRQALATHMEKHNKILHQIGRPALYFRQNGCSCYVVINHTRTRLSKLQSFGAVWARDSEELNFHVKFGAGSHIGVNWTIKFKERAMVSSSAVPPRTFGGGGDHRSTGSSRSPGQSLLLCFRWRFPGQKMFLTKVAEPTTLKQLCLSVLRSQLSWPTPN